MTGRHAGWPRLHLHHAPRRHGGDAVGRIAFSWLARIARIASTYQNNWITFRPKRCNLQCALGLRCGPVCGSRPKSALLNWLLYCRFSETLVASHAGSGSRVMCGSGIVGRHQQVKKFKFKKKLVSFKKIPGNLKKKILDYWHFHQQIL